MANLFKYLNILPFKYMQYGCVWNIIDITLYHHSIDIRSNTLFSNDLKCWWGMGGCCFFALFYFVVWPNSI